jgi:hypothetical protein
MLIRKTNQQSKPSTKRIRLFSFDVNFEAVSLPNEFWAVDVWCVW